MKWLLVVIAGVALAVWLDPSNDLSKKAHALVDSFGSKKEADSYLPAPNVVLPPSHPVITVVRPKDDDTTVSTKVDPLEQPNDTKHSHHSMDDMINSDSPQK